MVIETYGTVRDIPPNLVSGLPRFEIWFTKDQTQKIPFSIDERVNIEIELNNRKYYAGLRYLKPSKSAWICPDICDHEENEIPLSKILQEAGFKKNDKIKFILEDNKFLISNEIRAFSWTIESSFLSFKILDKSAFLHRGTGIPKEIRSFFLKQDLSAGDSLPVTLVCHDKSFLAHIDMEGQETARTRLFWSSDFTALLKETFPHHYQQYSNNQNPESQVILRLKRLSGFEKYEVSFAGDIPKRDIERDIESEELEEKGPRKEGRVKEYYGKRYERSPINRQQAIKHHGLSCNACGFNFEKVYGARGSTYIEVHHIKPIHTYEEEQHVDPKTDLTTVCANCHRMMHRNSQDILSIHELKLLISNLRVDASE